MKPKALTGILLLYFLGSLLVASCGTQSLFAASEPSSRVLFIGNSFTMINGGVDQQLKSLMPSVAVTQVAVGGYRLQDHWNSAVTLSTIRSEKWNYVVLQEQSQTPVSDQRNFIAYAGKLNDEIKLAGAETILFMTWERPDSVRYGVTTANLAQAYYERRKSTRRESGARGIGFCARPAGKT